MKSAFCVICAVVAVCAAPRPNTPKYEGRLGLPTVDLVAEESNQKDERVVNVFIHNFGKEPATIPCFVSTDGARASKSVKVYVEREGEISELPKPYGLSPLFLFGNPGDGNLSDYYANPQGGTYSLKPDEKKLVFRYAINAPRQSRLRLWFTLCIPDMGRANDVGEMAVLLRSITLDVFNTGGPGEEASSGGDAESSSPGRSGEESR
jgi:hypothetical protein